MTSYTGPDDAAHKERYASDADTMLDHNMCAPGFASKSSDADAVVEHYMRAPRFTTRVRAHSLAGVQRRDRKLSLLGGNRLDNQLPSEEISDSSMLPGPN